MNLLLTAGVLFLLTLLFHADCISWKRVLITSAFLELLSLITFIAKTQMVDAPFAQASMMLAASFGSQAIAGALTVSCLICQLILLKVSICLSVKRTLIMVLILFIVGQIPSWIASRSVLRLMTISSQNMQPTVSPGDCVLVILNHSHLYLPERNDIIAFSALDPNSSAKSWQLSRIVGLPGDSLKIDQGQIFINGRMVGESSSIIKTSSAKAFTLPEGACYCLGDNPKLAIDSRQWGLLPLDQIQGKLERIVFPSFPHLLALQNFLSKPSPPPLLER